MEEVQQLEQVVQRLIGSYSWMALGAFALLFFKETIQSLVEGIQLMMGSDINADDVIYISGRKSRVVRVGLRKTIFYMSDRGTKMIIPNTQLKALTIEKKLQQNGNHDYLPKETELPGGGYGERRNGKHSRRNGDELNNEKTDPKCEECKEKILDVIDDTKLKYSGLHVMEREDKKEILHG